jgi:hypothetical protein
MLPDNMRSNKKQNDCRTEYVTAAYRLHEDMMNRISKEGRQHCVHPCLLFYSSQVISVAVGLVRAGPPHASTCLFLLGKTEENVIGIEGDSSTGAMEEMLVIFE